MRPKSFPIWLLWLTIFGINGEVTLESVYQKVNDLEVEVKNLKVIFLHFHGSNSGSQAKNFIFRTKMPN